MKTKIFTLLSAILVAFTFSSCGDEYVAKSLEGVWRGDMYVSSKYSGVTYNALYSEIAFFSDPLTKASGTGYWIDYYDSNSPFGKRIANDIDWTVRNHRIYITLIQERREIQIWDYELHRHRYFEGTIHYGSTQVDFSLRYVGGPNYNWRDSYFAKPLKSNNEQIYPERIINTK